jgi:glycosyl transferase family 25
MQAQADAHGIAFERIRAVDGAYVPEWLSRDFRPQTRLSPGEVGCYASHLVIAQIIVAREIPWALVLEDDAKLAPDFTKIIAKAVSSVPEGWDIVHLSSIFKKSIIFVAELLPDYKLIRYTQCPITTTAYLISNGAARKILAPAIRVRPIDVDRRYAWQRQLNIFGVYPAPITQPQTLKSTIGARQIYPRANPISFLYGVIWTARKVGVTAFLSGWCWNYINSVRKFFGIPYKIAIVRDEAATTEARFANVVERG